MIASERRCPICKQPVPDGHPESPFCSARCRLLDLGNWASEKYAIPAPVDDASESLEENEE